MFTQSENDLIFVAKTKTIHRMPLIPQPEYSEYKGRVTWKDDFNNQGKWKFVNIYNGEITYIKQQYKIGDIIKVYGKDQYLKIHKVTINKIQDWNDSKIIKEGKNFRQGLRYEPKYDSIIHSRYEASWDASVEKYHNPNLKYDKNPWVIEIEFSPTNKKNIRREQERIL